MVKKIILGFGIFATLLFGANLQDGYNAIEKGDYKTAFAIFEDLAKKGDIGAQFNLGIMYSNGQGDKPFMRKDHLLYSPFFGSP
jgi:TPR repeat protein